MKVRGIAPDIDTYNSILRVCSHGPHPSRRSSATMTMTMAMMMERTVRRKGERNESANRVERTVDEVVRQMESHDGTGLGHGHALDLVLRRAGRAGQGVLRAWRRCSGGASSPTSPAIRPSSPLVDMPQTRPRERYLPEPFIYLFIYLLYSFIYSYHLFLCWCAGDGIQSLRSAAEVWSDPHPGHLQCASGSYPAPVTLHPFSPLESP